MSESLEALRNEMFETMQRMRQRRSTPPLPPGITRGEINALMMLSIMEARDEIVRPGMLAACSHATPGAVSQTLKSLEEKGLIVRRRGEGDSRSVTISLTDAGHEFEKEGRRLHDERFMHMLEFLGEDDAREFVRIVNRMLEFEESHPGSVHLTRCVVGASGLAPRKAFRAPILPTVRKAPFAQIPQLVGNPIFVSILHQARQVRRAAIPNRATRRRCAILSDSPLPAAVFAPKKKAASHAPNQEFRES